MSSIAITNQRAARHRSARTDHSPGARAAGIDIPTLCHHPALRPAAAAGVPRNLCHRNVFQRKNLNDNISPQKRVFPNPEAAKAGGQLFASGNGTIS